MDDKNIILCRCEDLTREEILRCIEAGCRTIDEIKRVTRAGMGPCQGRTCRMLIAQELSAYYHIPLEEVYPVFAHFCTRWGDKGPAHEGREGRSHKFVSYFKRTVRDELACAYSLLKIG